MTTAKLQLDHFIPYRMSITSNLVSGVIASAYHALFGLNVPEWRLIAVIGERDGITQQEICGRTRMDKMTVSRAAAARAERGLLERIPNPGDRRSRVRVLSGDGRRLYDEVAPQALAFEQRIFGGFSREELDRFVDMLRRIDAIAEATSNNAL
jgi:DNA-binding MarR family transcriptional regulator